MEDWFGVWMDVKFRGFVVSYNVHSLVNSCDFCTIDNSFERCFSSSWFWNIAAQPTFIPCLDPSVSMWWWSGKLLWKLRNFSWKVRRGSWVWIVQLVLVLLLIDLWFMVLFLWGWLVGWVLWHINFSRLSNAKSIFMQIISSISNNSV